jgi:hypothetical protein
MFPVRTSLWLHRCVRDLSSRLSFLRRSCNDPHTHLTVAKPWLPVFSSSLRLSAESYNVPAKLEHIDVLRLYRIDSERACWQKWKRSPFSIVLIIREFFFLLLLAQSIGMVPSACMGYEINIFSSSSLRKIKPISWIWQKVSQVQPSDF